MRTQKHFKRFMAKVDDESQKLTANEKTSLQKQKVHAGYEYFVYYRYERWQIVIIVKKNINYLHIYSISGATGMICTPGFIFNRNIAPLLATWLVYWPNTIYSTNNEDNKGRNHLGKGRFFNVAAVFVEKKVAISTTYFNVVLY